VYTKEEKVYKVMGTGSRSMILEPNAKEIYALLEYYLLLKAEAHPDLVLISGMAEGWDEAIAKVGLNNNIPYHVYLPNSGYGEYYWGRNSLLKRNRMTMFNKLLNGADDVTLVCHDLYGYDETGRRVHSNFLRNTAMVEAADYAVVYSPSSPGTKDAVQKLKKAKVPYSIYPFSQGELV
jgi:hypothetical protein